jgi:hypothetical protein
MTISNEQVDEWLKDIAEGQRELAKARLSSWTEDIASCLYTLAISKPVGVNDPDQLDYPSIAKECYEKAKEAAPYLLRELGLLPKETE